MYNTNVSNAQTELSTLVSMAIEDNEVINISTKDGNVVLINENDYKALLETLYLTSDPNYKQSLLDGKNIPLSDCIDKSDVKF